MKEIELIIYSKLEPNTFNGVVAIPEKRGEFNKIFCPFSICDGVITICRCDKQEDKMGWVNNFADRIGTYVNEFESMADKATSVISENNGVFPTVESEDELEVIEDCLIQCDEMFRLQTLKVRWREIRNTLREVGFTKVEPR